MSAGGGLIPARAGNTSSPTISPRASGAHPRSRGEHAAQPVENDAPPGSSPLARGTLSVGGARAGGSGLIPARAGNTPSVTQSPPARGAHPRSRGEHSPVATSTVSGVGSSPLARGTPVVISKTLPTCGLIPARAGNTARWLAGRGIFRAHPRSRGEHVQLNTPPPRSKGLIPARAGNTLADMGLYPLYRQNRITLKPEPKSRIHDKQQLLTTTSTAIPARLTPP